MSYFNFDNKKVYYTEFGSGDILNALGALKKEGIIDEILGDAEIIEFPSSNGTLVCKFVDIDKNSTEKVFLD